MRRVAIIPARGGSKRLPRKNVLQIGGRSMLSYPIACARESGLFEKVFVSTEDREIADVAIKSGATVIERPSKIAQDTSSVVDVCLHALGEISKDIGSVDEFCCIYATAVFISPDDLHRSLKMMTQKPQGDVVIGVSSFENHPVQALRKNGDFWVHMWPEFLGVQSQNYPKLVVSNGTLYWSRTSAFCEEKTFYVRRLKCYELPPDKGVDIDTPDDLSRARRIMDSLGREAAQ